VSLRRRRAECLLCAESERPPNNQKEEAGYDPELGHENRYGEMNHAALGHNLSSYGQTWKLKIFMVAINGAPEARAIVTHRSPH